ncbi:hypothetical protein PC123_g4487 [Phytophthora cactorum]|nr:hypothetical protein PC123_g4487 [Phytophthora cactorum]
MLASCPSTDHREDTRTQPRSGPTAGLIPPFASPAIPATPLRFQLHLTNMSVHTQYNNSNNNRHMHSLKVTATILTHLATKATPAIPGRHRTNPTRLPGIRSLFAVDAAHTVAAVLPPLQCAVGLINLGTPVAQHQSPVTSPIKPVVGSPTSPGMTPVNPLCRGGSTSTASSSISLKTRRPLSLHDLLSTETTSTPSTQRCTTIHHRRQCGAGKPPPDALLASWQASDSLLYLDENDGLSLLPESALEAVTACRDLVLDKLKERMDFVEQEGERKKTKKEDVEQVEDSLNVDEISDLFSCVEQEETSGVDFSVFIEDEDAVNVEEISQMFSGFDDSKSGSADDSVELTTSSPVDVVDTKPLEFQMEADVQKSLELCSSFDDVAACQEEEDADAENVAMLSEIFSATLEDEDAAEPVADLPPTYSLVDCKDAKNVNLVADLFTSLEESSEAGQEVEVADRSVTQDWIDALEVDNVASLFVELEQAVKTQTVAPAPVKVDSRVFVPTFSVRIEGGQRPGVRRPAVGPNSNLLVGPPGVLLAGPPAPSREERVGRWKSKRKTRSFATKQPDPSLSDTRRASAAKRQRVKGRFISDTHSFVSITEIQK